MQAADPVGSSGGTTLSPADINQIVNIGILHQKVALITGASSGLGRAIAQAYAAAGAYVVNADLKPDAPPVPRLVEDKKFKTADLTTSTVDLINKTYPAAEPGKPRAAYITCNVTDAAEMEAAVAFTAQTFGRLDIIVNNAGISVEAGKAQRLHEQNISILEKDCAVNIRGVWLGCKYAITQMLNQPPRSSGERGWIINICSIAGLVGLRNGSAYCASKGAVLQMTKSIALEYAQDQIHVNCINPGFVETSLLEQVRDDEGKNFQYLTSQHPWGRLAVPNDIAKMAVFLAGDGASFVTGAAFVVDGGYTAQ